MIRIAPPDDPGPLLQRRRRAGRLRLDRLHQRQRRGRVHDGAARRRPRRPRAEGPAAVRRRHRHRRAAGAATASRSTSCPTSSAPRRVVAALPRAAPLDGARVLLPRADIGREVIAEQLRERRRARSPRSSPIAPCSRTRSATDDPDVYGMLLEGRIDVVTFTSASAVRNFAKIYGAEQAADLLQNTVVAAIGPVTADAAAQLGIDGDRAAGDLHRFRRWSTRSSRTSSTATDGQPRRLDVDHDGSTSACRDKIATWLSPPPRAGADAPAAAAAPHRGDPLAGARDAADARLLHLPAVRLRGRGRARARSARCRASSSCRWTRRSRKRRRRKADGVPGVLLFGLPDDEGRRSARWPSDPDAPVQAAVRALKRELPDLLVDHRRLPVRVHLARPLRHRRGRGDRQRRDRRAPGRRRRCRTPWPAPTSWRRPT